MTTRTPGPNHLFDMLLDKYRLKNDAARARAEDFTSGDKQGPQPAHGHRSDSAAAHPRSTRHADLRAWGDLVDPRA